MSFTCGSIDREWEFINNRKMGRVPIPKKVEGVKFRMFSSQSHLSNRIQRISNDAGRSEALQRNVKTRRHNFDLWSWFNFMHFICYWREWTEWKLTYCTASLVAASEAGESVVIVVTIPPSPPPFFGCSLFRHLARRFWNHTCKECL